MLKKLRNVVAGHDRLPAAHAIRRHRHEEAYAIITLAGWMQQVNYSGCVTVRPGHLLVQPTLDCHANRTGPAGTHIVRLPWRRECGLGGLFELNESDQLARLAERDPIAASEWAFELVRGNVPLQPRHDDWEDLLAADLASGKVASLTRWAEHRGLAPETLSRGFARRYQCTPVQFRCEIRTRDAWLRLTGSSTPLVDIAAESGFADQAHMTRAIGSLTGSPPGYWRRRQNWS